MKEEKFSLYTYLSRSTIFLIARDCSPEFFEKYVLPSLEMPYTNCGYRDYLKAAHDCLCKEFEAKNEEFSIVLDIPREIVNSPTALTFVLRNREILRLTEQGEYTLDQILKLAVKNGHR